MFEAIKPQPQNSSLLKVSFSLTIVMDLAVSESLESGSETTQALILRTLQHFSIQAIVSPL